MAVTKGNNVSFLIGTQDKVDQLLTAASGIQAGAFYVTNDTHRMYFGAASDSLVALNQGVKTVASVQELNKEAGQFFYVEDANVLCIYNGSQWVQINPDTTNSEMKTTVTAVTNGATVSTVLKDNKNNTYGDGSGNGAHGNASFTVKGENITISTSGTTLTLKGKAYSLGLNGTADPSIRLTDNSTATPTVAGTVTIKGGDNISVTGSGSTITISGSEGSHVNGADFTTAVASNKATVGLSVTQSGPSAPQVDSSFTVLGGEGVKVEKDGTNGIKVISDSKLNATSTDSTKNEAANIVLSQNGTNKPAVQLKAGANVSSIKVTEGATASDPDVIEINVTDSYISSANVTESATNGFGVTLNNADSSKSAVQFSITPEITYGQTATTVPFKSGVATLSVYTQAEIDKKLTDLQQQADAMHFMGTASSADDLTTKVANNGGAHSGDTYKATAAFTWNGKSVKAGDLLVVLPGTEVNDVIDSPTWEIIPSGDDIDDYVVNTQPTNGIQIERKTTTDNEVLGGLTIAVGANDEALNLTQATNAQGLKTVTITHDTQTQTTSGQTAATQAAKGTLEIDAITSVTRDKNGHVTAATSKKFTVVDTHNTVKTVTMAVGTDTSGATLQTTVMMNDGDQASSVSVPIISENTSLKIEKAASANAINMNLVWGEF